MTCNRKLWAKDARVPEERSRGVQPRTKIVRCNQVPHAHARHAAILRAERGLLQYAADSTKVKLPGASTQPTHTPWSREEN